MWIGGDWGWHLSKTFDLNCAMAGRILWTCIMTSMVVLLMMQFARDTARRMFPAPFLEFIFRFKAAPMFLMMGSMFLDTLSKTGTFEVTDADTGS